MTTLSQDKIRAYETDDDYNDLPVAAATLIYEGCAVGDNGAGYMRKIVAGDDFRGFSDRQADNSSGAAGDINVHLRREGAVQLAIAGLAITNVDSPVYASDDDTFVLAPAGNTYIGRVIRFVSAGIGIVAFDVTKGSIGEFTALVDNTTGVPNGTLSDVGAAFNQATLDKNFAELAAKINAIAAMLK